MEFSSRALVLRVGRFREADLWVRFLSSSRGVNTAFAFGGSKSKRRFSGCLDQLNVVYFRIKTSRTGSFLTLQERTLLRGPMRLREDWQRFGIALNCLKFIEAFDVPPDSAEPAFSLATDLMDCLERADNTAGYLPTLFRGRFAFDQGYNVNFTSCATCGLPLDTAPHSFFQTRDGTIHCPDCPPPESSLRISQDGLRAFLLIQNTPPLSWMEEHVPPSVLRECARAIDAFVQYHVGLIWDEGRFRRV